MQDNGKSSRAKSNSSTTLFDAFQLYKLPAHLSQDYVDPVDGHVHQFQNRCLGTCTIQIGPDYLLRDCTFYEIIESEISDIHCLSTSNSSSSSNNSISDSQPHQDDSIAEMMNGCMYGQTKETCAAVTVDGLAHVGTSSTNTTNALLSSKERKRRRTLRCEIVFTCDGDSLLDPNYTFYTLPRDALTETLTQVAPHKVMLSYFFTGVASSATTAECGCHSYLPITDSHEESFKTKLDEFAAVCSASCKLTLQADRPATTTSTTDITTDKNEVRHYHRPCTKSATLSNVPLELYEAIKEMVSSYESMCHNMIELMKLHNEKVFSYKSKMEFLPDETVTSQIDQSNDDYEPSSKSDEKNVQQNPKGHKSSTSSPLPTPSTSTTNNHKASKSNTTAVTGSSSRSGHQQNGNTSSSSQQQQPPKKCLYCGSKSTPMWRRGPQGAGTLCNACGVKWKHGKILNGTDTRIQHHDSTTTTTTTSATTSVPQQSVNRRNSNSTTAGNSTKAEKKRKRSITSNTNRRTSNSSNNHTTHSTKKRATSISHNKQQQHEAYSNGNGAFAVPSMPPQPVAAAMPGWGEGHSTTSSSTASDVCSSPHDSSSSSPNTSPSIASFLEQQQQQQQHHREHGLKRSDLTTLIDGYDTETLSVYVGEDAVEAAAVLTLLKRS